MSIKRTRIWRIRKRYLEKGLEAALYDEPRLGRPIKYGDIAEAEIVALACSNPPAGQRQWSLPLLTQVAPCQSQILTDVSQETVRQVLKKKRCKPWLKKMWCIGEITPEYRLRMYALLEPYDLPYNILLKLSSILDYQSLKIFLKIRLCYSNR